MNETIRICKSCDRPAPKHRTECGRCQYRRTTHGSPSKLTQAEPGESLKWLKDKVSACTKQCDCIRWPFKARTSTGYGLVTYLGKQTRAHRVALILHLGYDRPELQCCHAPDICHDRLCVNPHHLRFDTQLGNSADMVADRTVIRGTMHVNSKLTESQVLEIFRDPRIARKIASEYGIHKNYVYKIKNGSRWSWLTQPNGK